MIVVEGPDGAGKTTLINRLREDLGVEVAPRVVSKDTEAMVDLLRWVHTNLRMGWQPTLFDRHRLISEPIYGPIVRGHLEQGFDDVVWFHEALKKFYLIEPVIIYCLPSFETVWRNVMSSEDNAVFHKDGHRVQAIWGAYFNKAVTDHALYKKAWIYDYTHVHAELKYTLMLNHLQEQIVERGQA